MKNKFLFLFLLGILILPTFVFAENNVGLHLYGPELSYIDILDPFLFNLWWIVTAISVICFAVAGVLFLTAQGNPDQLSKAKSAFLWGMIGVAIIIVAGSIVSIVATLISY